MLMPLSTDVPRASTAQQKKRGTMKRRSRVTRTTRATAIVLVLVATLLSTPRASAGFLGRHTILGKVFRMTPVGRVVRHFEERRDDYRAAQQWLDDQLAAAVKRDAELKQLYRQRQIGTRTYVEARTLNERRKGEYTELKDRMTRITRDNFQRAMAQEVLDRLMPRILAHRKFQKTLGEVNEAFDTTRGFLEGGIAGIDRLAAKADLGFLSKAREATQRLIERIDKRELTGVLLADVKTELQRLDGRLAQLQRELPEQVKPEQVVQLQQQAREAVQTLQSTQNAINQEVQRVRDQGTIVIPVRSASRDKVVQGKLKEFRTDARMVDRAVEAAKLRGEEQERVNNAIREAMDRLGIDRSDRTYLQLRKMAMEDLLGRGISFSELSDDELLSLWQAALEGARDRYTQLTQGPAIGTISMQADYPPGEEGMKWSYYDYPGWMTWRSFGAETYPSNVPCEFGPMCQSRLHVTIEALHLQLDFDLDKDTVSGFFSGAASGGALDMFKGGRTDFLPPGEGTGSFSGQITEGWLRYDSAAQAWSFGGEGWVKVSMEGRGVCCESCGCPGGQELYHVVLEGAADKTIPVTLEGHTAGERALRISGTADTWDFFIVCNDCKLPVELPAR
jgi:hypothetical protein